MLSEQLKWLRRLAAPVCVLCNAAQTIALPERARSDQQRLSRSHRQRALNRFTGKFIRKYPRSALQRKARSPHDRSGISGRSWPVRGLRCSIGEKLVLRVSIFKRMSCTQALATHMGQHDPPILFGSILVWSHRYLLTAPHGFATNLRCHK